jgi:magnesium-transporting ATPase (P-type)
VQLPEIVKFLKQFTNFFMILLNIAGVLSCIAYGLDKTQPINLYLGIVLFVVVFLTCLSSYFQERNSSNVMNVFGKMLARQCKVVRDGNEQSLDVVDLVPGDLVRVQGGTVVPADLRLIKVSALKVEASSLTGETDPIQCTVEATHDIARESANIAFNSAQCLEGEAVGIVIRTGDKTVIGRIAALAGGTEAVETTFQKEVKRVVYTIAIIAFSTAVIFFTIGMVRGQPFVNTFVNGFILVIVANIPQGLPATVTSLLTLTANRMSKKSVLVKKLECVETLGSCTVIASDKTGTLTENKMHVEHVWFDYHSHSASRITDRPTQAFKSVAFNSLYRVAALCNRAHFEEDPDAVVDLPKERENRALNTVRRSMEFRRSQDGQEEEEQTERCGGGSAEFRRGGGGGGRRSVEWTRDTSRLKIVGDASETALFRFCNQIQPIEAYQEVNPKVFEIPFNSTNKWQLSIHKVEVRIGDKMKERRLLVMKGAPEILMAKCSHVLSKGVRTPIGDTFRDEFDSAYKRFGSYGERVLAFAELELDPKTYKPSMDTQYDARLNNFPTSGLTFVGLISLMDPPRKGVKEAIQSCHTAGIRVVMVTGDHPFTAEAIAKKVGIIGEYLTAHDIAERDGIDIADVPDEEVDAVVIHGHTLTNYTQDDWDRVRLPIDLLSLTTAALTVIAFF